MTLESKDPPWNQNIQVGGLLNHRVDGQQGTFRAFQSPLKEEPEAQGDPGRPRVTGSSVAERRLPVSAGCRHTSPTGRQPPGRSARGALLSPSPPVFSQTDVSSSGHFAWRLLSLLPL